MRFGRLRKVILSAVLISLCAVFVALVPVAVRPVEVQASIAQVKITPEYRQTMARSMLPLINKWRAGNTWYYDSSNKKAYLNNLKALTYDYTLEKYAMQRAAEIAVSFEHTRPNGGTATGISGYKAFAENIAATTNTNGGQASYGFDMFKEEAQPYSGQGHRRLMLSVPGNFSNIGIACVYYKGAYYWCQTFAMGSNPNTKTTTALNGTKTMTVDVETSRLTGKSADLSELNNWKGTLKKGQTDYLPDVNLSVALEETWPYQAASVQGVPAWTSSNTGVATVNSTAGTITGVNSGSTNISMKEAITGASKSKTVSVSDPNAVTGVSLNKTTLTLGTGRTETLVATVSPANATNKNVTWSSGNTSVATVNGSGVVTGVKAGTAVITARTASGGKTATCTVTVTQGVTGVSLDKNNMNIVVGTEGKLTSTVLPANAINKNVTWSTSNKSVATVDQTGKVKGVSPGLVVITVKTQDGNKTASCNVRVQFKDVVNTALWYYKSVYWAADRGITTGSNGVFSPDNDCTREQVVTFLWRLAGKPEPKSIKSKFSDVTNPSSYSYKAIMWASENGIVTGTNGIFLPRGECTREQIVTIIWRFAGKPEPKSVKSPFSDVTNSKSYSYKAILWAAENGITTGSNGIFSPKNNCKRRDIVTFLYRYSN